MSDLIDRQAVIEIVNKHIFYEDYGNKDKIYLIDAIENLPSAEKRPTVAIDDDLISREALMDDLSDNAGWDFTSRIGMIISRQPTIEPKRGRWIEDKDRRLHWHCSVCAYVVGALKMDANYCPNCGARMENADD